MTVLEVEDLTRSFGGVTALSDVTFMLEAGARHVIFGPNGAGKTTLFRLISGEIAASRGSVRLFGEDVTRLATWRRSRLGLARTFQITNLFFELTVAENVMLACQAADRARLSFLRPRTRVGHLNRKVESVLEREGFADKAAALVGSLPYGELRLLEIAVALAGDPRVLLLDEPTAGVSTHDSLAVMDRVRALPPSVTVVLIEHDLDIAFRFADSATVLGMGELVAHGPLAKVRADPLVQELYLGNSSARG